MTYLTQSVLLQSKDPGDLRVTSDSYFGGLEGAVVPSDARQSILGTRPLLLRVARLEHARVLHLVLDLRRVLERIEESCVRKTRTGLLQKAILGTYHQVPFVDVEDIQGLVNSQIAIRAH